MKIPTSLTKLSAIAALAIILSTVNAAAATFTVLNIKDSGAGSLRDAIAQANADGEDDTINFDPTFFNVARTITLASELQITADGGDGTHPGPAVTINGPGASLLSISGNNVCRPFYTSPYSTVATSGITIHDGNGVGTVLNNEGGAMLVDFQSYLTLANVTARNSTAVNSGGGIYLNGAKDFTAFGSLFTENKASYGGLYCHRHGSQDGHPGRDWSISWCLRNCRPPGRPGP